MATAQGIQSADGESRPNAALVELSVVLVINRNDPSILNPDFLRYNEIIDKDLQPEGPVVSTPLFSQVILENGISVVADPDRFVFSHRGDDLTKDKCQSPTIARRFVEKHPSIQYSAMGINPTGFKNLDRDAAHNIANILIDEGEWVSFKDTMPEIYLKMIYEYEKRKISLDIGQILKEEDNRKEYGMMFRGNIHRDVPETANRNRAECLLSFLSRWKDDVSDFNKIVSKFGTERFARRPSPMAMT